MRWTVGERLGRQILKLPAWTGVLAASPSGHASHVRSAGAKRAANETRIAVRELSEGWRDSTEIDRKASSNMTLIAANAALYWLSILLDLPQIVSSLLGLTGCLAGALFLKGLFLTWPVSRACRSLGLALLVWAYPVCALVYALAFMESGFQYLIPDSLAVTSAIVTVIYPIGQAAIAITLRNFLRVETGSITAPQCC